MRLDQKGHWPVYRAGMGVCRVVGCTSKTHWSCMQCNIFGCLNQKRDCFVQLHHKETPKLKPAGKRPAGQTAVLRARVDVSPAKRMRL